MMMQSPFCVVTYHTHTATDINIIVVMTAITVNHPLFDHLDADTLFIGNERTEAIFT